MSQTTGFAGDALKNVVDKRIHDSHRLGRNAGIGVDLLQYFVNVDSIALFPRLSTLLTAFCGSFGNGLLGALLGRGFRWFWHGFLRTLLNNMWGWRLSSHYI